MDALDSPLLTRKQLKKRAQFEQLEAELQEREKGLTTTVEILEIPENKFDEFYNNLRGSSSASEIIHIPNFSIQLGSNILIQSGNSLNLEPRERWALTGPNGTGKTTLFRFIE